MTHSYYTLEEEHQHTAKSIFSFDLVLLIPELVGALQMNKSNLKDHSTKKDILFKD